MHKALYPRDDLERLGISRKEEGRGLPSMEKYVDASMQGFENYIRKNKERLITAASNRIGIKRPDRKLKNKETEMKRKINDKLMKLLTRKPRHDSEKESLKKETKFLLIAAQNNTIRTNYHKAKMIISNRIINVNHIEKK